MGHHALGYDDDIHVALGYDDMLHWDMIGGTVIAHVSLGQDGWHWHTIAERFLVGRGCRFRRERRYRASRPRNNG
jgi:hypothetical protein